MFCDCVERERGGWGEGGAEGEEGEGDSIAIYNQCTTSSYNILCCDKQFSVIYHPLVLLKLTAFVSSMATIVNLKAWPSCSHGNAARWVGFNGHPYSRQTMCGWVRGTEEERVDSCCCIHTQIVEIAARYPPGHPPLLMRMATLQLVASLHRPFCHPQMGGKR